MPCETESLPFNAINFWSRIVACFHRQHWQYSPWIQPTTYREYQHNGRRLTCENIIFCGRFFRRLNSISAATNRKFNFFTIAVESGGICIYWQFSLRYKNHTPTSAEISYSQLVTLRSTDELSLKQHAMQTSKSTNGLSEPLPVSFRILRFWHFFRNSICGPPEESSDSGLHLTLAPCLTLS